MPHYDNACQGLPTGPCPDNRCDASVKYGIYDLFLCPACEESRDKAAGRGPKKGKSSKKTGGHIVVASQPSQNNAPMTSKQSDPTNNDAEGANGTMRDSATPIRDEIVINELLAYVGFYRNRSNADALRRTVSTFYSPTEVSQAKRIQVRQFQLLLNACPLTAERRSSATHTARDAELEDITGIFDMLDTQAALNNTTFAAANLDNLPKYGPEEINVAQVVERQVRFESTLNDVAATVQSLSSGKLAVEEEWTSNIALAVSDLQRKLDGFSSSVNARKDQLSTVRCTASDAHNRPEPARMSRVDDGQNHSR